MSFGKFKGDVIARWLTHGGDDRDMELQSDFSYEDPQGLIWKAPKGSIVNGASIPSALWSTVGSPFVGDYRRASVIHDVACGERRQPDTVVHLMFYNAMRADGVSWTKANVMYQAVKQFGPTWNTSGGSIRSSNVAHKDEDVLAFAKAVELAAEQIDESEGLRSVEARAHSILAESKRKVGPPSTPGGKSGPKHGAKSSIENPKKATRVAKVTKIQESMVSHDGLPQEGEVPFAIGDLNPAVRDQLSKTQLLSSFRKSGINKVESIASAFVRQQVMALAGDTVAPTERLAQGEDGLSDDNRLRLVDQAQILLEQNYAHRPLKEAMHAINPVQKLRLLREEVIANSNGANTGTARLSSDIDFHRKLLAIFLSTRDLHTNYLLPDPFASTTAYLPFLVEDYFDRNNNPSQRRFLVTRTVGDLAGELRPGVEILRWNGVPIERAVELNGEKFAGSNREASRARGLETLTVRPLMQSLPPDEDFVLIEFRKADGTISEIRLDWLVFKPGSDTGAAFQNLDARTAVAQGIDLEQAMVRLAKRMLFAPESVAADAAAKAKGSKLAGKDQGLQSSLPSVLQARAVTVDSRDYGYVRIRTFSVRDADSFVNEFVRLIEQLPQNGLIIDVRGNGGGLILAGEQLLQVLTPRTIEPTLFQLLNTPLNRRLVERTAILAEWRDSMRQAVLIGAPYSQGFPITSWEKANKIGQKYFGPVVLITDALCYSTTDIFAAGFQDHEIGTIIGIDNNTGAGGANVWTHDLLTQFMQGDQETPYLPLPSNAAMRVSIRRTLRVGKSNGTVLEDLGVVPDILYAMSQDDLLNNNVDLLARAAEVLANRPARILKAQLTDQDSDSATLNLETLGIDRVDIYQHARPLGSVDVEDGTAAVSVSTTTATGIRLQGFDNGQHVASRRL